MVWEIEAPSLELLFIPHPLNRRVTKCEGGAGTGTESEDGREPPDRLPSVRLCSQMS